jgi:SAM-dependent methyltransferase
VDAVTVAQAFHWFRVDEALAEIRRVLRPGGGLGLIWNGADAGDPVQAALREIIDRHRGPDPPPHCMLGDRRAHAERWRPPFEASGLFGPLEHAEFEHVQALEREALPDRVGSISMIGALPPAEREAALAEVRRLAQGLDDPVPLRYLTDAYVAVPR